jgi:hypothetical protein
VRGLILGLHRTFSVPLGAPPRPPLPPLSRVEVKLMTESWKDEGKR